MGGSSGMTHEVQTLRNAVCRSSRLDRLNFTGVYLANNSPCCAVGQSEDENEQYDKPSARSVVCVDTICCIKTAYDKHATGQANATGDN